MTLGSRLAKELPFLRRYARAVTGSQRSGDAAVRELLEALLEAPEEFDMAAPARLELYRVFHKLWAASADQVAEWGPAAMLDSEERHALMLTAVEGFSQEEAALILGMDAHAVALAVENAKQILTQSLTSRAMIIEDEPMIALHIKEVLEEFGHSVSGIARTHAEAVKLARQITPELVLADINLADGSSGIGAVQEILAEIDVPVVFVTSFPEQLLTGEGPEPTYLLTKPFVDETLLATIGQALMFHRERTEMPLAQRA